MARSFLNQDTQVLNSQTYDDTLAAGATLESGASSLEDDLNSIRSQFQNVTGETNWYDASATTISALNTDVNDLEAKPLLFGAEVLTDVTVTAAQNWEVLSVAGSETPSEVAAVGAVTTSGAVVAAHGGTFGTTHSLTEVSGPNAIQPKNLVVVRDASTGEPIQSDNGKDVYGLLHSESAVDGHTFDDATNQVQISFVRENSAGSDLEACPVADIAGKSINYQYVRRIDFDSIPESAFLSNVFSDRAAASVDVTLDNAIDNQGATAATQSTDIDIQIADNSSWAFQDPAGAVDILRVDALAMGDQVEMNVANLDVNATGTVDFSQGVTVDSGGTSINLGTTAGQIDAASSLTVSATGGSSDLTLSAGLEIKLVDGNKSGSTYAGDLKLAETSGEWDTFETNFGEVSLLNAINQAANTASAARSDYITTGAISADTDFDPGVNATLINGSIPDISASTFVTDVDVYVNGQLLINGANAAANNDVYPGTDLTNGELKFEFALRNGAHVTIVKKG